MKNGIILALFLFSVVGSAQNVTHRKSLFRKKPKKEQAPAIPAEPFVDFSFADSSGQYDFGNISNGPDVSHDFVFKNIGNQPLVITNVQVSCGCTAPEWPKEPVMPGKTAIIKATFHTSGRPGDFYKPLTVLSNAKSAPKILYIKGKVAN